MPLTIAIIEDESGIRLFLRANLEARGYSVHEAATGPDGLALLNSVNPDLLILDYRLPELNGNEILQAMQADSNLARVPVIVLSASMTLQPGDFPNIAAHLIKPVDVRTFLATIEQVLAAST